MLRWTTMLVVVGTTLGGIVSTAVAHPDVGRTAPRNTVSPGVIVEGVVRAQEPTAARQVDQGFFDPNNPPNGATRQGGEIDTPGGQAPPGIIDLNWCESGSFLWPREVPHGPTLGCGASVWQWDHNFVGGRAPDPNILGIQRWTDFGRFEQCITWQCTLPNPLLGNTLQFEDYCNAVSVGRVQAPGNGGRRDPACPMYWPPPATGPFLMNDPYAGTPGTDILSNGFRTHPNYLSHIPFFVRQQSQDSQTHQIPAREYCLGGVFQWHVTSGDCSTAIGGGGYSAAFDQRDGNCGCNIATGYRAPEGPFRPDWRPWRPPLGSVYRTANNGDPFQTVNRRPVLSAAYSDPDGQQWPFEGDGTLGFVVQRVGTNQQWTCIRAGVPEQGVNLDADGSPNANSFTQCQLANNLNPGAYRWLVIASDHHGLANASDWRYFTVINPGTRTCDPADYEYLCDAGYTFPAGAVGTYIFDNTAPGGATPTTTPGNLNGVFSYELTPPGTGGCTKTTLSDLEAGTASNRIIQRNQVMQVGVRLNGALGAAADNQFFVSVRGQKAVSLFDATFEVGDRSTNDTYQEAIGCL